MKPEERVEMYKKFMEKLEYYIELFKLAESEKIEQIVFTENKK